MTDEIFLRRSLRTIRGKEYFFNVYLANCGYIAHSLDFDILVIAEDKYTLQDKMELLVSRQESLEYIEDNVC
jgi:hypothetical protein